MKQTESINKCLNRRGVGWNSDSVFNHVVGFQRIEVVELLWFFGADLVEFKRRFNELAPYRINIRRKNPAFDNLVTALYEKETVISQTWIKWGKLLMANYILYFLFKFD